MDTEILTEQVRKSISELDTELDLEEEGCYKEPKYTYESPEVQAACDAMNQYCRASIIYELDQPVVVDKALISGWLKMCIRDRYYGTSAETQVTVADGRYTSTIVYKDGACLLYTSRLIKGSARNWDSKAEKMEAESGASAGRQ